MEDLTTRGLALRIEKGAVSVNGQIYLLQDKHVVSENGESVGDYVALPENAVIDTLERAVCTINPMLGSGQLGEPYTEIRGQHVWRICVLAGASSDSRPANPPISYVCCEGNACFPYLELQVNEGCVRVAAHR